MALVNLQYRTFSLKGLHVNWRDWIDSICNTELSPTASSSNLPLTVHCILTSLPDVAFDLLSVEQPKEKKNDRGETTFSLPELKEQLKIVAFILVKD